MVNDYTYLKDIVEDLTPDLGGILKTMPVTTISADSTYLWPSGHYGWVHFRRSSGLNTNTTEIVGRVRDTCAVHGYLQSKEDQSGLSTLVAVNWVNNTAAYGVDTTYTLGAGKVPTGSWPAGQVQWNIQDIGSSYVELQVYHTEYYAPSTTITVRGLLYIIPMSP